MACGVLKKDRKEYVQLLILDIFQQMAGDKFIVTLDTSLGKYGMGHTPKVRKLYREPIAERLAIKGCIMATLKPTDFSDTAKRKSVGDIADMVEKDLM